jgi:hypothetical protein
LEEKIMTTKKPEQVSDAAPAPPTAKWSNEPMMELTPREEKLSELAKEDKNVEPKRYDITSKNPQALRVVHDYNGRVVTIQPGTTKQSILLRPSTAEYLSKGDLTLTASST